MNPDIQPWSASVDYNLPGPGIMHLWRFDLTCSAGKEFRQFEQILSSDETQRADRLLSESVRRSFIIARARLRFILASYLDCAPVAIRFAYGPQGKPFLDLPGNPDLQFNLAHSGQRGALVLMHGTPVGVDLEKRDPTLDCKAIAGRYFSTPEQEILESLPEQRRGREFLRTWTRKEVLIKLHGADFSEFSAARDKACFIRNVPLAPGYVCAVAAKGEVVEIARFTAP